ncbi:MULTISPECIES: DUF3231 family protein [Paenibacillus]|uniref:DUF3231 family protein n=1 Tax=Paenibacillus TaxID=44249 RepID=UPI000FD668DB
MQKHIELLTEKLSQDGLPSPTLKDHLVTSSAISPFSDKFMVFHKVDMFNVKIREYANGLSLKRKNRYWCFIFEMPIRSNAICGRWRKSHD